MWIEVLPSDDAEAAGRATRLVDDLRATHFHDAEQLAGHGFADRLGLDGLAWDVYLLYQAGETWVDPAPGPTTWFHQLGGERAHPDRRRTGHELVVALHESVHMAGDTRTGKPPGESEFFLAKGRALGRLREPGSTDERCARCVAAGRLSSCSLGSWSRLLARAEEDGTFVVSGTEPASVVTEAPWLELQVTGMLCPECMLRAAAAPLTLDGVEEVEVVLDTGMIRVLRTPGHDDDEVAAAVGDQGFAVR